MKLRGAWRRDYSEFFDTQEALLIDAMDNADSIYTVFARLQSLAVKCGCAGKLLLHDSVPYTDEMLVVTVTSKTVSRLSAMRAAARAARPCHLRGWHLRHRGLGVSTRTPRRSTRCARETACASLRTAPVKNGKGTRQLKKDKVLRHTSPRHPEATNTEVAEKTGVSRPSVIKYRREYTPALPAPKGGNVVKDDAAKIDTVKTDDVKVDSFDSKVDVNFDVKVDSDFDTGFYTDADGKSAGETICTG